MASIEFAFILISFVLSVIPDHAPLYTPVDDELVRNVVVKLENTHNFLYSQRPCPEAKATFLSRISFWWMTRYAKNTEASSSDSPSVYLLLARFSPDIDVLSRTTIFSVCFLKTKRPSSCLDFSALGVAKSKKRSMEKEIASTSRREATYPFLAERTLRCCSRSATTKARR